MTDLFTLDSACPDQLRRDGACLREGVARWQGCQRNWARTTPRSTITNTAHHELHRSVEKVGRSIKGSETPHSAPASTTQTRGARRDLETTGRSPASAEPTPAPTLADVEEPALSAGADPSTDQYAAPLEIAEQPQRSSGGQRCSW